MSIGNILICLIGLITIVPFAACLGMIVVAPMTHDEHYIWGKIARLFVVITLSAFIYNVSNEYLKLML